MSAGSATVEAIDTLGDSLAWELEAVKYQTAVDEAAITNGEFPSRSSLTAAENDMSKTLIAGDVHNHYSQNRPIAAEAPQQPAPQTPAPPPTNGTLGKLVGPALLGAALLGTGAGGVALYDYLSGPSAPAADTNTQYKFDISSKPGTGISSE